MYHVAHIALYHHCTYISKGCMYWQICCSAE